MRWSLSLSVALLGFVASSFAADAALDGKWVVTKVTRDGKEDKSLEGAIREHAGEKYSVTPKEGSTTPPVAGTVTLDSAKKTIDMKPATGRYKDKTLLGIYKLDGDVLTIAFAEPGKDRPKDFDSKEGSGVIVAVHKKK